MIQPSKSCSSFQLFVSFTMLFYMSLVITRITILAAANVTVELSDSGMLRHVTTKVWSRLKSFAANMAPARCVWLHELACSSNLYSSYDTANTCV